MGKLNGHVVFPKTSMLGKQSKKTLSTLVSFCERQRFNICAAAAVVRKVDSKHAQFYDYVETHSERKYFKKGNKVSFLWGLHMMIITICYC